MIIRRLGAGDDLTGAIDLLLRFFSEEGFETPANVIKDHAMELAGIAKCGLFVGEEGGETVAVATVSLEFGIEYGWWAEMGDLYVVSEHRRKGLSLAMVEAIEVFLKQQGASGYQVTVAPYGAEHHALAKFYKRLGFDDEGRVLLAKNF
jgi:GNAT superfamily N-acetyltransferase